MIAGLRCNYPRDGPGFSAGSRSDGFCRLRRNQAPLSLYAIVLKLHDTCDQEIVSMSIIDIPRKHFVGLTCPGSSDHG